MTAPSTKHSAYPKPIDDLMPAARRLTAKLGALPSRNQLKTTLKIGAPKASAVLAGLVAEATETAEPAAVETVSTSDAVEQSPSGDVVPARLHLVPSTPEGDNLGDTASEVTGPLVIESERATVMPAEESPPAKAVSAGRRRGIQIVATIIAVLAGVVVMAPLIMSSQDLYRWASSPDGLGLNGIWPYFAFLSLDAAAVLCIAITIYSAWRNESGGAAHLLVWMFAAGSAFANYRHNLGGPAADAVWFFPAMSIAGALLLEITIGKLRQWVRTVTGQVEPPLPKFRFARWLVAPLETGNAWRFAVTERITEPAAAIEFVRTQSHDTDRSA